MAWIEQATPSARFPAKAQFVTAAYIVGVTFIGYSADAKWCTCACSMGQLINVCSYGEVSNPTCFGPCYKQEVPDEQAALKLLESLINGDKNDNYNLNNFTPVNYDPMNYPTIKPAY